MSQSKVIARNKKALRDYFIEDRYEAGMVLKGSEVKSLRAGKASLSDAYVEEEEGELFVVQCHIAQYAFANINNHEPLRRRKLLLNRQEIYKITRKILERGYTAVALSLYFKGGKAKLEIGLARGKRQVDKRHDIRRRDENRETERELKQRSQ
jgi:SsrA-binding protein